MQKTITQLIDKLALTATNPSVVAELRAAVNKLQLDLDEAKTELELLRNPSGPKFEWRRQDEGHEGLSFHQ